MNRKSNLLSKENIKKSIPENLTKEDKLFLSIFLMELFKDEEGFNIETFMGPDW